MKSKYLFLFIILMIGCTHQRPVNFVPIERMDFPIEEYKALKTEGTGIVTGQAFLKTRGGDVKKAAGNGVLLNPVTSYSKQWYSESYLSQRPIGDSDYRYDNYQFRTVADGDGKFEFNGIPSGDYYLVTSIFWEAAVGHRGALVKQGGVVAKIISVQDGKELKIILTR